MFDQIAATYPAACSAYYAELVREIGDPIWKQCVPDPAELEDDSGFVDPLDEERYSPVPGIVHRYNDRVLFLVTDSCPVLCRFCTRKRRASLRRDGNGLRARHEAGLRYIEQTDSVRDVLVSGGDPLTLDDEMLFSILNRLASVSRLDIIRIGTRIPCTLPERITPALARRLAAIPNLFINTHCNHPRELTPEFRRAIRLLTDAGIPLGCQTVLMRGVNDNPDTLSELFRGLLKARVRPYYLHIMDLTRGTGHFRISLRRALAIYGELQASLSGMALPKMMLDLPGGGGKVPLMPDYLGPCRDGVRIIRAASGCEFAYPEVESDG